MTFISRIQLITFLCLTSTCFANDPPKPTDTISLGGLNLMNLEMKKLLPKLAEWTDKVIIPVDSEINSLRLTIYSKKQHTRESILKHIYSALNQKGFIIEETEDEILIKKAEDSKIGIIPTIGDDTPLISIEDQTKVVQKIFKLKVYSPKAMQSLIMSMKKSDRNFKIISDENTNTLIVIDTVFSLIGIESIIKELDVPEADQTLSETIEIGQGDPLEIVQLLKILLSQDQESSRSRYSSSSKGPSINFIGPSLQRVILVPIVNQNWIIVKASAEDMKLIKDWIEKFDIQEGEEVEQEMVPVQYLDVEELANRLNAGLQQQMGVSTQQDIFIQPLEKAKKILIFGSAKSRERIKRFIAELDIPSDSQISKRFDLKYADPDQIKTYLEELFTEEQSQSRYSYYRSSSKKSETGFLRVISNSLLKQVTIITSPENMDKIEKQIIEWDTPINLDNVKPLILTLKNSDPEKMVDLLSTLFTEKEDSSDSFWGSYWSRGSEEKEKIVGALYGKLSFAAVPDTKKIVIISKIPEAYAVIQEIIGELDSEDMAELPKVIVLKYADPEELSDQLNALLNERGTEATLKRRIRGLSPSSTTQGSENKNNNNQNNQNNNNNNNTQNAEFIKPWWTNGQQAIGEGPISNLVGKVRFIPVHRSKAILVLSPPEYRERIENMIHELDQPGKQVLIKAIIMQVGQRELQALGSKLSSNRTAFGDIGENVLTSLTQVTKVMGDFSLTADINLVVDLLKKEANAKIINQPLLWTMDNEEAEFFRGDSVAFKVNERVTDQNNVISDFEYRNVGASLRVRPNITPDNSVNMTISLEISSVDPELINGSIAVDLVNTTTRMNVKDGETVLLGGIVFKSDSLIKTDVPGLSKIPVLGYLFKNRKKEENKNELLVFITPVVIDGSEALENKELLKSKLQFLEQNLDP